jgi:hypothetical protein
MFAKVDIYIINTYAIICVSVYLSIIEKHKIICYKKKHIKTCYSESTRHILPFHPKSSVGEHGEIRSNRLYQCFTLLWGGHLQGSFRHIVPIVAWLPSPLKNDKKVEPGENSPIFPGQQGKLQPDSTWNEKKQEQKK